MKRRCVAKSIEKRRRRRRLRKLRAACLTVGLATAWGAAPDSQAATLRVEVTPSQSIENAAVFFNWNSSGNPPGFYRLGSIGAGETATAQLTIDDAVFETSPSPYLEPYTDFGYTVVASLNGGAGPVVSLPDAEAIVDSAEWADLFPTADESGVVDDLSSYAVNPTQIWRLPDLHRLVLEHARSLPGRDFAVTPYGVESVLTGFSTATHYGTAIVYFVPEPAAWVILVMAGSATALGRRE